MLSSVDVDECALMNASSVICHELARCSNTEGSFECTCEPGYIGDGIQVCEGM